MQAQEPKAALLADLGRRRNVRQFLLQEREEFLRHSVAPQAQFPQMFELTVKLGPFSGIGVRPGDAMRKYAQFSENGQGAEVPGREGTGQIQGFQVRKA